MVKRKDTTGQLEYLVSVLLIAADRHPLCQLLPAILQLMYS